MKVIGIIFFFLLVYAFIGGACTERTPESKAADDKRYQELALKTDAQQAVRAMLKDPESANFKDVRISAGFDFKVVCGQVNSKNGFGAYTGYQYFVSGGTSKTTYLQEQVRDFKTLWNEFCY